MYRFSKESRLLTRADFDGAMNDGERAVSSRLVVIAKKTDATPRLGLVVSKKVGSSVDRNRIKRLVRESFRHLASGLANMDVVVIARDRANGCTSSQLNQDFAYCLRQLEKRFNTPAKQSSENRA